MLSKHERSEIGVGRLLVTTVNAEGAKSAKRAEKTSKKAAAHALPAARASREQEGHEIPETSSALKLPLFVSEISCPPGTGPQARRGRKGIMQPFSAVSASLLPLREIVFSALEARQRCLLTHGESCLRSSPVQHEGVSLNTGPCAHPKNSSIPSRGGTATSVPGALMNPPMILTKC